MFEKNIGDGIYTTNEQFKKAGLEESERNECVQNSDLIISKSVDYNSALTPLFL